jgi:predicted DCC family thiol-disulfide oxidoreductase YuxK
MKGVSDSTQATSAPASGTIELPVLIYDGDCAFCSSSVRFIERRLGTHPTCKPWQWLNLDAFGVTQDECERAVQFIATDGRVYAGERGIARTLVHAGRGWAIVGRVMLVPGVRHIAGAVYRWVSKNRHRMPGGTPQCSLPAAERVSDEHRVEA